MGTNYQALGPAKNSMLLRRDLLIQQGKRRCRVSFKWTCQELAAGNPTFGERLLFLIVEYGLIDVSADDLLQQPCCKLYWGFAHL